MNLSSLVLHFNASTERLYSDVSLNGFQSLQAILSMYLRGRLEVHFLCLTFLYLILQIT